METINIWRKRKEEIVENNENWEKERMKERSQKTERQQKKEL